MHDTTARGKIHEAPITYAPSLFALSILLAVQGAFVALVLSTRLRGAPPHARLRLLAGAAISLAVAIWGMHFVGMLAMRLPMQVDYLVRPTLLSFLAALVAVAGALGLVAGRPLPQAAFIAGSALMGGGIVAMHFIGMQALRASVRLSYNPFYVAASAIIGVSAAGLALHLAFRAGPPRRPPILPAILMGLAISGMHYTAMEGTRMIPRAGPGPMTGLSPGRLAVLVALVACAISAGFLLALSPPAAAAPAAPGSAPPEPDLAGSEPGPPEPGPPARGSPNAPLQGLGGPARRLARALPAERDGRTVFVPVSEIQAIRANGHYTALATAEREVFCTLSIGAVEAQLDPARFMRVHRSHILAIAAIVSIEKSGDGGLARVAGPGEPVPVSRGRFASLKARLAALALRQEY